MTTIEVLETSTGVVEVISQGPQGIPGTNGTGEKVVRLVTIGTLPMTVVEHDGTAATEKTIPFTDASTAELSISNGVLTLATALDSLQTSLELHVENIGGGNKLTVLNLWAEFSVDLGVTWATYPLSYRKINIADESSGLVVMDMSTDGTLAAGLMIRLRATKTGAGNTTLKVQPPTGIITSNGPVSSFSNKVLFSYSVQL